jgi:hypothetical protein
MTPVSAVLHANVNPNTLATTCYFQYGTNTAYGSFSATNSLAAGLSGTSISSPISGLLPGTTYHFQPVASNSLGTSMGADMVFTTPPVMPPTLGGLTLSAGGFQFGFTNWPGLSFSVLATTNAALPLSQWQMLGAPSESPAGQYQFTDPQALTNPQTFYLLRQP